jgi:hypothetical protein
VHVFAYKERHACLRLHPAEIRASSPVAAAGCRKLRGSDALAMDQLPGLVCSSTEPVCVPAAAILFEELAVTTP